MESVKVPYIPFAFDSSVLKGWPMHSIVEILTFTPAGWRLNFRKMESLPAIVCFLINGPVVCGHNIVWHCAYHPTPHGHDYITSKQRDSNHGTRCHLRGQGLGSVRRNYDSMQ